jgi:AcrR family transcriptional regulator
VSPKTSPAVRGEPTFIEAARRAQILDAALETIAEVGFANASLARIARQAGISKSVIGYYFPTKDDLIRQAVDRFYLSGHEAMLRDIGAPPTPTEMLARYISSNIDYIDKNRTRTRAIGEILANFRTPEGEPVYKPEDAEPMIVGTAALFDWGQQTGDFRKFDSRVMALLLRAAIDAFGQQLTVNPGLDTQHYVSELTETFQHATRAVAPNPERS